MERPSRWMLAVVVVGALFALGCYVLPLRGCTYLWDDWAFIERVRLDPWPARWLAPHMGHWAPLFLALAEAQYRAFGPWAWGGVWLLWGIHVLDLALLYRVVHARTGDERAAALATGAFALSTVYREVLWWGACGGIALATTLALVGLLGLDRARAGRRGGVAILALVPFLAGASHGIGIAVGPALALEAALLLEGAPRRRALGALALSWGAYVACYLVFAGRGGARLPATPAEALSAACFFGRCLGAGVVRGGFLVPCSLEAAPVVLSFAYAVALGATALVLPREQRARLAVSQGLLVLSFAELALARWSYDEPAQGVSRYEHLAAISWTIALGLLAAEALRRAPRGALAVGSLLLALHGAAQARAAREEPRRMAPRFREAHVVFVEHVTAVARRARGPLHDVWLPFAFPDRMTASELVGILAPDASPVWTTTASAATDAPWLADPIARGLPALPRRFEDDAKR